MCCATFTKLVAVPLTCVVVLSTFVATQGQTIPQQTPSKTKSAAKELVDLNKASLEELEANLPGVGPATAKKIVDGRPYTTVDDLSKAGINRRVLELIRHLVTVGGESEAKPKTAGSKTTRSRPSVLKTAPLGGEASEAPAGKVNLNTADSAELEALPGIGPTIAKAIIEARPWKSVDELDKIRGLGKNRIAALRNLVTTDDAPATTIAKKASARAAKSSSASTKVTPKTQPGQKVDLNTATKEELDSLPGIGPVKAQAIIDTRPFKTIEDVMKVRGIKEGEFSKIKDLITVQ
jgi:competence protein ComEA